MGVKPELAFDVCWEVYRGAREVLETKRGLSTLDWKEATKFLWRPDFRPRLNANGWRTLRWRAMRRSMGRSGPRAW